MNHHLRGKVLEALTLPFPADLCGESAGNIEGKQERLGAFPPLDYEWFFWAWHILPPPKEKK
jgi:hypothetical protein